MHRRRRRASAVLLAVLSFAACGESPVDPNLPEDPGDDPDDTGPVVVGTVGAAGGTLTADGGAIQLTFPAGAVDESTEITVESTDQVPSTENLVSGSAVDFGPDGLQFAEPVELSLSYDPDALPNGHTPASLGVYKAVSGAWQELDWVAVDTTTNRVTAQISSFSIYALRAGRVEDIAGDWTIAETVVTDECEDAAGETFQYGVSIEQNGSAIQVTVDGETYDGTVDGSEVRWSGSYEEDDGGTVSLSLHVTIEPGGEGFEGTSTWSYTGNGVTCGGSSSFVGTRGAYEGGPGGSSDIARIEITPLINNVPQVGSTVTVRPEIGESLKLEVRAYDADDVEVSDELVSLASSAPAVVAIPDTATSVQTPAAEVRPTPGEPGTATITATVQTAGTPIEASIDVVVERPVSAITMALPDGSLIHDVGMTIDVQDENPYVDHWIVRLGGGEPIDTIHNSSIDCEACGPKLHPTLFWSMDTTEQSLYLAQAAVNVEGYTQGGTLVSQSSTYFYNAAPTVFYLTADDTNYAWGRFALTPVNHNLDLVVYVDDLIGPATFDMCEDNANDQPMAQVIVEIDYVEYRSSYVSPEQCSGAVTVSAPSPYVNGHTYTLEFSGTVQDANGVQKSVSGVVHYPHVPDQPTGTGVWVNGW